MTRRTFLKDSVALHYCSHMPTLPLQNPEIKNEKSLRIFFVFLANRGVARAVLYYHLCRSNCRMPTLHRLRQGTNNEKLQLKYLLSFLNPIFLGYIDPSY